MGLLLPRLQFASAIYWSLSEPPSTDMTEPSAVFASNAHIIHVDIDPSEIGRRVEVDVSIVGDCRTALSSIEDALKFVHEVVPQA